jgi:hypothetical protein
MRRSGSLERKLIPQKEEGICSLVVAMGCLVPIWCPILFYACVLIFGFISVKSYTIYFLKNENFTLNGSLAAIGAR